MPTLSEQGQRILDFLVREIRRGRFRLHDPETFCGYKEIHDQLDLPMKGPHWGASLTNQGLADLAKWARGAEVPAITGLVVSTKDHRPGDGYYNVNGIAPNSEDWWREQIAEAIRYDWSAFVQDYEPVTEAELAATSRVFVEGCLTRITVAARERCAALRKRAAELHRSPDGFLRCRVCNWRKPDHRFTGDIVELHHVRRLSALPAEGEPLSLQQAIELLVPVCPTCHRLLHAGVGGRLFTIDELHKIISAERSKAPD